MRRSITVNKFIICWKKQKQQPTTNNKNYRQKAHIFLFSMTWIRVRQNIFIYREMHTYVWMYIRKNWNKN